MKHHPYLCMQNEKLVIATHGIIKKTQKTPSKEIAKAEAIPTMRRVFKALGVVTATIDLGIAGKVALW